MWGKLSYPLKFIYETASMCQNGALFFFYRYPASWECHLKTPNVRLIESLIFT